LMYQVVMPVVLRQPELMTSCCMLSCRGMSFVTVATAVNRGHSEQAHYKLSAPEMALQLSIKQSSLVATHVHADRQRHRQLPTCRALTEQRASLGPRAQMTSTYTLYTYPLAYNPFKSALVSCVSLHWLKAACWCRETSCQRYNRTGTALCV
jgi:hypothetical protein